MSEQQNSRKKSSERRAEKKKYSFDNPKIKTWTGKSKTLGLDLGIASVGWCLYENETNPDSGNELKRIIDIGSYVFDQIEDQKSGKTENIARREKRSMRRQRRRRVLRLSDARKLFSSMLSVDFQNVVEHAYLYKSPLEIKIKGLSEPLSKEELSIALYHYLKYRGFKSNRKTEKGDKDEKKILGGIQQLEKEINDQKAQGEQVYISEILSNKFKENGRYHNTDDQYFLTVSHAMYRDEINALLDKQISFGVVGKDFKNAYLKLFDRRRDFSEGPGRPSEYAIIPGENAGVCLFDGNKRACKDSFSAKRFVLLSSLNNLTFKTSPEGEYQKLPKDKIKKIEEKFLCSPSATYKQIFKSVGIDNVCRVKGKQVTRSEYRSVMEKLRKDGIDTSKDVEAVSKALNDKMLGKTFFSGSDLLKELNKAFKDKKWQSLGEKAKFFDQVADVLFKYKTDESISKAFRELGFDEDSISKLLNMPNATQTINLSYEILAQIIPELEKGHTYDEAMAIAGWDHYKTKHGSAVGFMPPIEKAVADINEYLTNPVVKHTLVQMRKIVNAVAREYGAPTDYCIEMARELKKNFNDRKAIREAQEDNQLNNIYAKNELLEKYPNVFKTFRDITRESLLKYKLFEEQGGVSPYTNEQIIESTLFDKDSYQIDHILPYSRSFDDSFNNKVLVEAKQNQEKRSRTPLEYLGNNRGPLDAFLRTHNVSVQKRNNLLAREIDSDFLNKDFEDTCYIATLSKKLIEAYMLPEGKRCRTISGSITDKLRKLWGLSGKTHSFVSSYEKSFYAARFFSEYHYESLCCSSESEKDKGVQFTFMRDGEPFICLVAPVAAKEDKKNGGFKNLSEKEVRYNQNLTLVHDNISFFINKFQACVGKDAYSLQEMLSGNRVDCNSLSSERFEAGMAVVGEVISKIMDDVNAKDRSNDLHHALDAAVIGAINPKLVKRITEFYKKKENEIDFSTGEIKLGIEQIPLPYSSFRKEVLSRVYERDEQKLLGILNALDNYKEVSADKHNVHVLIPVRLPKKDVKGAISGDTIFGLHRSKEGDESLTKSVKVGDLTKKNIENIFDKDGGNKAVYLACKEWLQDKNDRNYPILAKKGTPIRSVKIVVSNKTDGKVDLSNGRYADNSNNIRVDVYKKNGDDKTLYFCPIYYYQISRKAIYEKQMAEVEKGQRDKNKVVSAPMYTLMFKQGKDGNSFVNSEELEKGYTKVTEVLRCSLVEITKTTGEKGLAYSGGATSGVFEVYSCLGDDCDLISSLLFSKPRERMLLTCSTIKEIKVRNISILGKIS